MTFVKASYRTYTNSEGESVSVDAKHLDKAVEIKLELQNNSPSRKCNWKQHKFLMEVEGFYDSDTNEQYRCLVKAYQKEIGKLHSLPTHADMVATSKLESIKMAVGDMYKEKRDNQLILNEMNKLKRELVTTAVIAEQVRDAFLDDIEWSVPVYRIPTNVNTSHSEMFVTLTDLHIGALVHDVFGNSYNYNIAKKRLERYVEYIADYAKIFGVSKIRLVILGDLIEHVYMRAKQKAEVEFTMSEQIVKATQILIWFILQLAQIASVEVSSIAGNHDRMQGDKDISLDDDNANVIINESIKMMFQSHDVPNVFINDMPRDAAEINATVNGKSFKFVHGHLDNGNKKDRLKSYISMSNEFIDYLVYGHLHWWNWQESDNGRFTIGVGSIMGRNKHSKSFGSATNASQGIFIVRSNGDVLPIRVDLQIC